jgi:hypothetical protein
VASGSLVTLPNYGIGVIGFVIDGPLASAFGAQAVFGVGAVYGLLSTAVVLSLPSIRAVRWRHSPAPAPSSPEPVPSEPVLSETGVTKPGGDAS